MLILVLASVAEPTFAPLVLVPFCEGLVVSDMVDRVNLDLLKTLTEDCNRLQPLTRQPTQCHSSQGTTCFLLDELSEVVEAYQLCAEGWTLKEVRRDEDTVQSVCTIGIQNGVLARAHQLRRTKGQPSWSREVRLTALGVLSLVLGAYCGRRRGAGRREQFRLTEVDEQKVRRFFRMKKS